MTSAEAREREFAKYRTAYSRPNYKMGERRKMDAQADLRALPARGNYLDVSCGKGEMLDFARSIGFAEVRGTEIVPALIDGERIVRAEVHALPFADKSFDVVSMFDVIEHLIPGDDLAACRELRRVARAHILITANNHKSFNHKGDDLHINRRPYPEWHKLFIEWFAPLRVTWIKGKRAYVSECFQVDL